MHSNNGPACQSCGRSGHQSGRCCFPPRTSRLAGNVAPASGERPTLPNGPSTGYKTACCSSFADYSKSHLGVSPPPPLIIPWCQTWKITAPEFDDDSPSPSPAVTTVIPNQPPIFTSFGEFARAKLDLPFARLLFTSCGMIKPQSL